MANPDPPIRYTRTADNRAPTARLDLALPRAMVVVEGAGLDAGGRALAARLGGLDPEKVDLLSDAGLPVPLGTFDAEAEARAVATRAGRELSGVQVLDTNQLTSRTTMLAPLAGFLGSAVLGVLLPLPVMVGWPLILAPFVVGLGVLIRGLIHADRRKEQLREALRMAAGPGEAAEASTPLLRRVRALRGRLSELPPIAAKDLQESLAAVEAELRGAEGEHLERLEAAIAATEAALSGDAKAEDGDAAERLERQARVLRASAAELSGRTRG